MRDAHDLLAYKPEFFYEPRVLWGAIGLYQNPDPTRDETFGVFLLPPNYNDYLNGGRWPIVLTKVIAHAMHTTGYPESAAHFINRLPIEIGLASGLRYSLGEIAPGFAVRPMATAREPLDPLNDAPALMSLGRDFVDPRTITRDVQNTMRWDFDQPCVLPAAALMEVTLSGRVPTVFDTSAVPVEIDTNFYAAAPKEGANFPGSAYTKQRAVMPQLTVDAANMRYQNLFGSFSTTGGEGSFPFAPFNGFFGGASTQVYPQELTFTSKQMVEQKATFVLPTKLRGMSVTIDQRALDDEFQYAEGVPLPGSLLSTTLARVRSRNGGTGAYWWRDGLPLAAAFPTQTPGMVSDLARPMVLQPGEALRVTVPPQVPFRGTPPGEWALPAVSPPGQSPFPQAVVYLSFTGYAVVEA